VNAQKSTINERTIEYDTHMSKRRCDEFIATAKKLEADPDKEKRLEKQECKTCYYIKGRVGGQAITTKPCGLCETEMVFGSTSTDKICKPCGKEQYLCVHCGGDISFTAKRQTAERVSEVKTRIVESGELQRGDKKLSLRNIEASELAQAVRRKIVRRTTTHVTLSCGHSVYGAPAYRQHIYCVQCGKEER